MTFASGYQSVYQAMVLILVGIPLYSFLKARREREGLVAEPVDRIEAADGGDPDAVIDLTAQPAGA